MRAAALSIHTAPWVVPVSRPPIADGGVAVADGRIVAVDEARALTERFPGIAKSAHPGSALTPAFGGLQMDREQGAVYVHGQPLELPPRELALLRALLAKPGHAIAKERLFEVVFAGELDVLPEAIEVVAYRLRKKLADTGVQLVTLRGLGYLLKLQTQAQTPPQTGSEPT